ncbi:MAG: SUMF1/EgtB/PvdO family nonheme iron enzyme [Akkermansiaceae bacterium]|nr:SUMF1/EgtB/PvdO family nonheme iron enzyme [Akkermansiaceae bacterium]
MKTKLIPPLSAAILAAVTATPVVIAQESELNATGQKLEASFSDQMNALEAELKQALSRFDAGDKEAYLKAREAEIKARKEFESYNTGIKGGVKRAEGLVNHAKNKWIRGAEHNIRRVEKQLKNAKNDGQRKKLEAELAKWQKNKQEGLEALAQREKALELARKAETEGPRLIKEATEALAKAQTRTREVLDQTGLSDVLMNGALDGKLAKYMVLKQGSPTGLALFAQQNRENMALIDELLANENLMFLMLVHDGPDRPKVGRDEGPAQYGPAMKIYTDILKASPKAKSGTLHELALACALEHAVPVKLRAAKADTDAPEFADPVKRYLAYEKAFLDGELDPAFRDLNAWEMRFVINGEEPEHINAWGRTMMRNFRPEHTRGDYGWRYVRIVPTDVRYGSQNVPLDRDELQFFQNIIMNGGICGRRAFFGRYILRSFGIPTIARPSRGHAALAHWTPKGWVVNLGPGWGGGWTTTIYKDGRDFVATSAARMNRTEYPAVKRAHWMGEVAGEKFVVGPNQEGTPEFWNAMALHLQQRIITKSNAETLEALGTNLGEADGGSEGGEADASAKRHEEKITVTGSGTINIPAAAFSTANGGEVQAVKSHGSGLQVFLPRFFPKGVTIMRGNTWKDAAEGSDPAHRTLSSGYGRYNNWGLRAAITAPAGKSNLPREFSLDLGEGVKMDFVYIKPGTFTMGGEVDKGAKWHGSNTPKHEVTISKGFYLGKTEVTQRQFEHVMGKNTSDKKHRAPDMPVDNVSETDADRFCVAVAGRTGAEVRLPTEAEWEYAARAGNNGEWFSKLSNAEKLDHGWFKGNSGLKSHPVGQKKPNPWGLHDIYGNVCERVADRYDENFYKNSPKVDPISTGVTKTSAAKYEVTAPKSGNYDFSSLVCTVNYGQHLMVSVNDGEPVNIELPYTSGEWHNTEPVTVKLRSGKNTVEVYRIDAPQYGIAVKAHSLTPAN